MSEATPRLKLLIVDDIEDNLLVLEALLRRPELEIHLARSGRDALELLLQHEVALALVDVQMPEMDGFELAEIMRGSERTRSIPIIFVTAGLRDQERVFRGYELGAVDFLVKPIEPPILRQKVDVFLELHRQRAQLSDALRLNETFVAVLAHDLRTPLNAVSLSVDVLARSADPAAASVAERLRSSTRRMAGMIEQLCDLSRARLGGGFTLDRRELDLVELVRRVVQELEALQPRRTFVLHIPDELRVCWDEGRIAQVLSNVVGNAVRHGDGHAPIEIRVHALAGEAIVEVRNEGTIREDARSELFAPFKSHPRGPAQSEGLGLGLYIAQQIVLGHDGRIDVSSDAKDTTVRIAIPVSGPGTRADA